MNSFILVSLVTCACASTESSLQSAKSPGFIWREEREKKNPSLSMNLVTKFYRSSVSNHRTFF